MAIHSLFVANNQNLLLQFYVSHGKKREILATKKNFCGKNFSSYLWTFEFVAKQTHYCHEIKPYK